MFPIKLVMGFLIISEVLIWLGPIDYQISNSLVLGFYLVILNLVLFLGYKRGVSSTQLSSYTIPGRWLRILLIVGLIASFRNLLMVWSNHGLSVSLSNLIAAILNPGEAYLSESEDGFSGSFFDLIVLDPIRWAAIPMGLAFWKRLSRIYRAVVVLIVFIAISSALGVGVRKGLLDVILIFFFIMLSRHAYILADKRNKKKLSIITVITILVFLFYFSYSIASRKGENLLLIANYSGEIRSAYENLPGWLTFSLCSIDSYLCQGYYALSKALEIGIQPIVPFGDSWVAMYYSEKFFGYDPLPHTYMAALVKFDIDPRINWHTMYVWLANQYTFIGVPFVIYWVGYSLAVTWKDALNGKNDIVFPLLAYFLVMCFYMFANNQVFSDAATSFWIWYFLYYSLRKRIVN